MQDLSETDQESHNENVKKIATCNLIMIQKLEALPCWERRLQPIFPISVDESHQGCIIPKELCVLTPPLTFKMVGIRSSDNGALLYWLSKLFHLWNNVRNFHDTQKNALRTAYSDLLPTYTNWVACSWSLRASVTSGSATRQSGHHCHCWERELN